VSTHPKILVIVGPTASGKTTLALSIAKIVPSEIISADSRQIYKYLTIGTAKPSQQELNQIPHHFIDLFEPDQKFNAGDFQEQGRKVIAQILEKKKLPVIVGGTGLYVKAIIDGFFEQPEISGEVRTLLEHRLEREGKDALYKELQSIDPESASTMDASKFRRVIRALEIFHETGIPISQFHKNHTVNLIYDAHFFGLNWERSVLYERINTRVDNMISSGFLDEVKKIQRMGFDDQFQSLQTVGYKEAYAFLRNEITKERMIELMKQNTRRFAKRQMTWFRKEERIQWFDLSSEDQIELIAEKIVNQI
jgi:tRNA dimethylallyltransferase